MLHLIKKDQENYNDIMTTASEKAITIWRLAIGKYIKGDFKSFDLVK